MKATFLEVCAARERDMSSGCTHSKLPNEKQLNGPCEPREGARGAPIVRKAVVGDWKNYFSASQIERMKAKMAKNAAVLKEPLDVLWKDVDLP